MNFTALFLALMFSVATLFGQEAVPTEGNPVLLAQAATPSRDNAVTSLNDTGAKDKEKPKTGPPTEVAAKPAPAPAAKLSETSATSFINTMTLWKLIEAGGWAMIPLGFLSVVTVMLVLVYLFTLRRGAILT